MKQAAKSPDSLKLAWLVWGCAAIFYFYQFIHRVGLGVIATDVMRDLHLTESTFGFVASAYSLAYAGFQLPLGIITDRLGTRVLLIGGATIVVVGALLFANSPNMFGLMGGRFLVGAGSAVGFLCCIKLATVWFPHTYLSRISALTMSLGTIGANLGGKPFALLADHVGWRLAIIYLSFFGLAIIAFLFIFIRDRHPKGEAILEKKLAHQGKAQWLEALMIVLRNPLCWWVSLYNLLMYVPLSGFADLWGTPFLTQAFQIDRPTAARLCMTIYIGMALGSPLFAFVSERFCNRRLPMLISSFSTFIIFSLVLMDSHLPIWLLEVLLFSAGLSLGGKTLGFTYICELTPHALNGTAIGFLNCICMLSGLLIQPLIGSILTFMWGGATLDGCRVFTHTEYAIALSTIPICLLIAALIMLRLPETYRTDHRPA